MARKKEVKPKGVTRAGGKPLKFDKDGWPELPFMMKDTSAFLQKNIVVLAKEAGAFWGVTWGFETTGIVARTMKLSDSNPECGPKRFHWVSPTTELAAEPGTGTDHTMTYLLNYRKMALEHGATPEAIRLLHGFEPFTDKEVDDMSKKLEKKTAPAKAEKPAKAPKTEGTEAPKRKGNPEALKKAREARESAGPDVRKITVLKKDNPYREGSNRASSFAALKGAKTVQEYVDAGGKKKYIERWAAEGIISLK